MGKFVFNLVFLVMALFLMTLMVFRFTEGSFQAAGARMDQLVGVASVEIAEQAREIAADADAIARDIADGPDDEN